MSLGEYLSPVMDESQVAKPPLGVALNMFPDNAPKEPLLNKLEQGARNVGSNLEQGILDVGGAIPEGLTAGASAIGNLPFNMLHLKGPFKGVQAPFVDRSDPGYEVAHGLAKLRKWDRLKVAPSC